MPIFKRGKTWWVDVRSPSGERVRRSIGTSDPVAAQQYHDELKASLWKEHRLGLKPDRFWEEAASRWLDEAQMQGRRTVRDDALKIQWFNRHFKGKRLSQLTRDVVQGVLLQKLKETSPATANRFLSLIRAILRRAEREWEWIERAPVFKMFKESKRRVRYLEPQEAQRLLDELPEHQRDMMVFALATGLRQGNVKRLRWADVNLDSKLLTIPAEESKNGRPIAVPLNKLALEVLQRRSGTHPECVFTYKGKPINQVNTKAWRAAKERAGIKDYRWHDNRHTWASWLRQNGVSLDDLQELGSWQTPSMVLRYAHIGPSHLQDRAEVIDSVLKSQNLPTREASVTEFGHKLATLAS